MIKKYKLKDIVLLLGIFCSLAYILISTSPLAQNQQYHHFVDSRTILGVPNFFNVITNLGFLVFGSFGTYLYLRSNKVRSTAWAVFFMAITGVSFGSAYYHLDPNDMRLFWDRLPMTIAFTSLFMAILQETHPYPRPKLWLIVANLFGLYTLLHWVFFDDLRLYLWLQFTTILTMIYFALFYKPKSLNLNYLLLATALYVFAKFTEHNDHQVYDLFIISGHSFKHILASLGILLLVIMKLRVKT